MAKLSVDKIKSRIAVLQKELQKAENAKQPAIRKVLAFMKKLGVTVVDLKGGDVPVARKSGEAKVAKPRKTGTVAVKYKDEAGNTWTGRGKSPRWLVEAEKTGKTREQFLI